MWLDEQRSSNPLRIPHPKFDKLAYQTQGVGIFAKGEICLRIDAYCLHVCFFTQSFYHICRGMSIAFQNKIPLFLIRQLDNALLIWYNILISA